MYVPLNMFHNYTSVTLFCYELNGWNLKTFDLEGWAGNEMFCYNRH